MAPPIEGERSASAMCMGLGFSIKKFTAGNRVFAMAGNTYAELCVVKVEVLADVPEGLDLLEAAALPLVTTTGNLIIPISLKLPLSEAAKAQATVEKGGVGKILLVA